jgi:RNA polymerase sigma-70 factor (ECF subfamily)
LQLRLLAPKMLRGYPSVRRWKIPDDLLQNAMLRLHRAMAEVRLQSVRTSQPGGVEDAP